MSRAGFLCYATHLHNIYIYIKLFLWREGMEGTTRVIRERKHSPCPAWPAWRISFNKLFFGVYNESLSSSYLYKCKLWRISFRKHHMALFWLSAHVLLERASVKRKNNNNLTVAMAVVSMFIAGRRTKSYKSRFNDFQTVSYGHAIFIFFYPSLKVVWFSNHFIFTFLLSTRLHPPRPYIFSV